MSPESQNGFAPANSSPEEPTTRAEAETRTHRTAQDSKSGTKRGQRTRLFVLRHLVGETLAGPNPLVLAIRLSDRPPSHPDRAKRQKPSDSIPNSQENRIKPTRGKGHIRRIFTQFPPYHLLSDEDILVVLAVVDGELQAHEVGQDGGGAFLGADWRRARGRGEFGGEGETRVGRRLETSLLLIGSHFSGLSVSSHGDAGNGFEVGSSSVGLDGWTYGTMLGPAGIVC